MSEVMQLDGKTIEQTETPGDIAVKALQAANLGELEPRVRQTLHSKAQDYENESHVVPHLNDVIPAHAPRFTSETLGAQIAHVIQYDVNSPEFEALAAGAVKGRMSEAEFDEATAAVNVAAEFGRVLARHLPEKEFADEVNGIVADVSDEGKQIDVRVGDDNVQVMTCFAGKGTTTTGKKAEKKLGGNPDHIDYYVVLHFDEGTNEKRFGVAVNDLSNGIDRDGTLTGTAAKNALK